MSTEESKRVASQFFATIGKGDIAALTEMADPECVGNFPGLRTNMNREQLIATISANQTAFPDLKADIQDQFAEGEKVVTRTAVRVTHGGPYYDVPATGNNVSWWGLRINRVVGGKIMDRYGQVDMLNIVHQMGGMPAVGRLGSLPSELPGRTHAEDAILSASVSSEYTKTLVRRVIEEIINKGEEDSLREFVASTYVEHSNPLSASPEGFAQAVRLFRDPFPDVTFRIEDVIAEGAKVATRGKWRGTHQGDFMGIAPKGTRVEVTYTDIWWTQNGKVVERWIQSDLLGLLVQLGITPLRGMPSF